VAKAGEAVNVLETGGAGTLARTFIDEVVGECDMSGSQRRATTFKVQRAIGIELMHTQPQRDGDGTDRERERDERHGLGAKHGGTETTSSLMKWRYSRASMSAEVAT
jgi:hypothetical protein